jgi:conjugative relaxase-like TrwC/TraI family protein
VLTVTALTDAEYVLSSVALGIDEYYAGVGEAPGVWSGAWSHELGLEGMVEAVELRALIDGKQPLSDEPLLVGWRERTVKAFDLTFSAPKSVSLLWALGSEPIADTVMTAHRDAVAAALGFLEAHAATARLQVDGIRPHVDTHGWAVAGFVHRTSREGDPQVHTHCVVPNVVCREPDGRCVALAARPLFVWARAAGSIYQAELQRSLSNRLGVDWGPDRANTRDLVCFTTRQLRAFSKRSVEIEAELEARGARYESPVLRMQADQQASLATRPPKDQSLTPNLLAARWETEAAGVGLAVGRSLDAAVCWRDQRLPALSEDDVVLALVDEGTGLCAHSPRFTEPDVIERIAGLSAGRLTVEEVGASASRFLASDHVVRLVPARSASGWEVARWSTAAHRALEDETLELLDALTRRPGGAIAAETVTATLAQADNLGADQRDAVAVLCGHGASVRAVLAPAGHGKTAMVHAAARAALADGRAVVAVATTAKAVAELSETGLGATTIARFRLQLAVAPLAPGTVVVLDEISQTSTRDAHAVLAAVEACPGAQLWVLGDARQSPSVKAGGIAAEFEARLAAGVMSGATLSENRRQLDPVDRLALELLRAGNPASSQELRAAHGWEHDAPTPSGTRSAMADAVVADLAAHGPASTVALVVSHAQAEDLADRIRARLDVLGHFRGPGVTGPGWTTERHYRAGDRILLHARHGDRHSSLVNGTVATITAVRPDGLTIRPDRGEAGWLQLGFIQGVRADGSPNVSHAWARTVDGAQGGTWDHAHLLGSVALDAYRGYTGQSRARHPTHTWNTVALDAADHGGRLADRRIGSDRVAAALARVPDVSMAAPDDPWPADRQLRAAIVMHEAVLDRQSPDRSGELEAARLDLAEARARFAAAEQALADTIARVDDLGALSGLTKAGRTERHRLERQLDTDRASVVDAAGTLAVGGQRVTRLEGDQAAHDRFEATEGWRRDVVTETIDRLDAHWSDVAVACVRADQPLAYGPEPLRLAYRHRSEQLAALDVTVPADRTIERDRARTDVVAVVQARGRAEADLTAARQDHDTLAAKRWPRRDTAAIGRAAEHVERARASLEDAIDAEAIGRTRLAGLDDHQASRRGALDATAPERRALSADLTMVDDALDRTRAQRVLDLGRAPYPLHLGLLGPVPDSAAGHAVWCHAAYRLEEHLDFDGTDGAAWDCLCRQLSETPELCAAAHRYLHVDRFTIHPDLWAQVADQTHRLIEQLAAPQRQPERPELEYSVGLDIGP